MPCCFSHNPTIDYKGRIVSVGEIALPTSPSRDTKLKVMSMSMHYFGKIVKKLLLQVSVFQVVPKIQPEPIEDGIPNKKPR